MIRKKEKSDNIWDKVINALWYLLFGFMLLMCVLIFASTTGHCASNSTFSLPYYVNYYHDNYFNDSFVLDASVQSILDSKDFYYFSEVYDQNSNYVWIYVYYPRDNQSYTLNLRSHDLNYDVDYNVFDFTTDYVVFSGSLTRMMLRMKRSDGYFADAQVSLTTINNTSVALLGRDFTTINSLGYTVNIPYHLKDDLILYDGSNNIVFANGEPGPVIDYGHATPPDEFHNPYFNPNSHAQPPEEVPPQVTINNYTWNTYNPPAIDDTDIISTLKSLIYVVNYLMGWLKDNISGEFQNLLSNLSAFFDYIGQTIQYYGGLIIDNIQNLITTFYNNMVSLVEDIAEKVGYISEPFDSIALTNAFQSMQIYDDYDRCGQLIDDAFGFFDDISEPSTFTIPIDLRGITLLHQTRILYLDLGWINSAKTVIRAFMWMVTTFGLLYTVIDSIPDYLQGQDE